MDCSKIPSRNWNIMPGGLTQWLYYREKLENWHWRVISRACLKNQLKAFFPFGLLTPYFLTDDAKPQKKGILLFLGRVAEEIFTRCKNSVRQGSHQIAWFYIKPSKEWKFSSSQKLAHFQTLHFFRKSMNVIQSNNGLNFERTEILSQTKLCASHQPFSQFFQRY